MIKSAIVMAMLLTSACGSKCDQLKTEFKKISSDRVELVGNGPLGGLEAAFDPLKRQQLMELSRRMQRLQNDAIQAECPIDEVFGLKAG